MSDRIGRLGFAIGRAFRATAPDPFVLAVGLLVLACALGCAFGDFRAAPGQSLSTHDKLERLADSFRDPGAPGASHAWSLLAFTMQMCLVLVSGHVLASTAPVRRAIDGLANVPRSGRAAAAMVGLIACMAAIVNWGLGLIVGALLAREVGRSLARRSIPHHYPLIAASGYFGLMVWHGGLSGSAPLTMSTIEGAAKTLPADLVRRLSEAGHASGIPLDETIFGTTNLLVTLGSVTLVPVALFLLSPSDLSRLAPCALPPAPSPEPEAIPEEPAGRLPDFLERSPIICLLLAIALGAGLWRFLQTGSLWRLGINEINALMLVLGLVLHASPRRFVAAVDDAARSCGGIIIQFPIYAAIIAVMINTGLVRVLASVAAAANPDLLPLTTFLSAGAINLFVPSGGGQWAVQGPVALDAALNLGVAPGEVVMAVAYGDQATNMLQPFWALPLLAITGVRARDIVGYTAIVMVLSMAWTSVVLLAR